MSGMRTCHQTDVLNDSSQDSLKTFQNAHLFLKCIFREHTFV